MLNHKRLEKQQILITIIAAQIAYVLRGEQIMARWNITGLGGKIEVKYAPNELLSHLALDSHPLNQQPFRAEILYAMDTNTDTDTTIKWMPVYQPPPFDVQKRIEQLRGYLDPNNPCYERKEQHTNIKAVIKLYEDGKIDGVHEVCIMDGKIVPKKEIYTGKAWGWLEGIRHQFAQKQTYGHGPFGLNAHEVSKKKVFAFRILNIYNSFFRFECC
jgi:hypothetical protein